MRKNVKGVFIEKTFVTNSDFELNPNVTPRQTTY